MEGESETEESFGMKKKKGIREEIWEERAQLKAHLRDSMGTYSRSLLKYTHI